MDNLASQACIRTENCGWEEERQRRDRGLCGGRELWKAEARQRLWRAEARRTVRGRIVWKAEDWGEAETRQRTVERQSREAEDCEWGEER
jgi:hypothetical protein